MAAASALGLFTRTASGGVADLQGRAHGAGGVSSLEVLGGGLHVCSGGRDGSVCVWDVRTGATLAREAKAHGDAVTECCALGGSSVLTTSLDGTVKVWDVSTMEAQTFGKIHRQVYTAKQRDTEPLIKKASASVGVCRDRGRGCFLCFGGPDYLSTSQRLRSSPRACAAQRGCPLRSRTSAS